MKNLIIFIVLSFTVAALAEIDPDLPEYVDGIEMDIGKRGLRSFIKLRLLPYLSGQVRTRSDCDADRPYDQICDEDCRTLLKCNGNTKPYSASICPPHSKYCVGDKCTATKDTSNVYCERVVYDPNLYDYICTTPLTHFPDPKNCSQYFNCDEELAVTGYYCPKNYVYDSYVRRCKLRKLSTDCSVIKCDRKDGLYVPYPADPSYYGHCTMEDKKLVIIMHKCVIPELSMNESTQICDFQCKGREEGVLDSTRDDCIRYYVCSKASNGKYVPRVEFCPIGYVYDVKKQTCVIGDECIV